MPNRTSFDPSGIKLGRGVSLEGQVQLDARGRIFLGTRTRIDAGCGEVILRAEPGAEIFVDEDCSIGSQVIIHAASLIHIGRRCHIGAGVVIFEQKGPARSHLQLLQPVIIEADVLIEAGALIKSGVRIGWGSRIGAGMLVTRDLPPLSNLSPGAHHRDQDKDPRRGPLPEALLAHEAWFAARIPNHPSHFTNTVAEAYPPLGLVD